MSEPPPLSAAQRGAISSRVGHLIESIGELRRAGLAGETLAQLEVEVRRLAGRAGVQIVARPPALSAIAVGMLVTIDELEPRRLGGYGELAPEARALLEAHVARLRSLCRALLDEFAPAGDG